MYCFDEGLAATNPKVGIAYLRNLSLYRSFIYYTHLVWHTLPLQASTVLKGLDKNKLITFSYFITFLWLETVFRLDIILVLINKQINTVGDREKLT